MQATCAEQRANESTATKMGMCACAICLVMCLACGLFFVLTRGGLFWAAMHHPEGPNALQHPIAIEFVTGLAAGLALMLTVRSVPSLLLFCAALYWSLDVPLWREMRPFVEASLVFRLPLRLGVLAGAVTGYLLRGRKPAWEGTPPGMRSIVGRSAIAAIGLVGALTLVCMNTPPDAGVLRILGSVLSVLAFALSAMALVRRG